MTDHLLLNRELDFEYGVPAQVSPCIRRVIAENPSPFTFFGTGTYLIGREAVCAIDPGPDLPAHIAALNTAISGARLSHILITHTHLDHSPAARPLKAATGATIYGFGPHGHQRTDDAPVEEGADHDFTPDETLRDGDVIEGDGWTIEAVHTPGHTSNHLCYCLREEAALFSGDHVMGWSTSVISPPDGDMGAYFESLDKLAARDDRIYWPTHGPPITAPQPHVRAFIAHRRAREAEILACLERGIATIPGMVATIYADVAPALHPAAARSVLAHLIHLVESGRIVCDGPPTAESVFGRRL